MTGVKTVSGVSQSDMENKLNSVLTYMDENHLDLVEIKVMSETSVLVVYRY